MRAREGSAGWERGQSTNNNQMAIEVWQWSTYVDRVRILSDKKLGCGSSANVYQAELDGQLVAMKVYMINHGAEYARDSCVDEAKMHAYLQQQDNKLYNQYVLPLLKSFCVPARDLYVNVFPCGTQSLFRYVHRSDIERMAQGDAIAIMLQVLKGLAWMHSCGVAHCDLSTGNVVETMDGQWRIIDLGACKMMGGKTSCIESCSCDRVSCRMNDQYVCSRWYRSPEVILRTHSPGFHMDVWAAGCMLAEMLLGRPIFTGKNAVQVMQMIVGYIGLPSASLLQQSVAAFVLNDPRLYPPSWISDEYFAIDASGAVQFKCQFTTEECVGVQHEALLNPRLKQLLGSMLCYIDSRKTAEECVEYINLSFFDN